MMLDGMFKSTAKKKKSGNLTKDEMNSKLKLVHEREKEINEESKIKKSPKKKTSIKKKSPPLNLELSDEEEKQSPKKEPEPV